MRQSLRIGIAVFLAAAALAGCDSNAPLATDVAILPRGADGLAPLLLAPAADAVPGQYVVVMHRGQAGAAPAAAADVRAATDVAAAHGGRVHRTYGASISGFAATLPPAAVEALRRNPNVKYVAQDAWAELAATQLGATWGLDRVDQRVPPYNTAYTYTRTGAGVRVYVIDSGIRTTHQEFGGRASVGADFVGDGQNGQDCNGHGTHVAGTVAGSTYGVAKAARVVSVRVFGCTGGAPFSTLIAAVDWVTANAVRPAVANMSISGGYHAPMNEAVQASIASGVTYVVAAGNDNVDACNVSPASTPQALTVGATNYYDQRSWFSNWGACLDLFAPGYDITSAYIGHDSATHTMIGTSMAAPHVAGVAALFLEASPTATPATVAGQIVAGATQGQISSIMDNASPNRLLYTGLTVETPVPVMAISPDSLVFTFVRPIAGTAAAAPAVAPVFQAIAAAPRAGTAVQPAGATATATSMATTLGGRVLLSASGEGTLNWTAASDRPWITLDPPAGTLNSGYNAYLTATVNAASLAAGTHTGTVLLEDGGAANSPMVVRVRANVKDVQMLSLGVPRTGLAGEGGSQAFYAVEVPAGATSVSISTSGGTGDVDLYVRVGDVPSLNTYNCRPWGAGNDETCYLPNVTPGTYYVMLVGYGSGYSGLTLTATTAGVPPAPATVAARPSALTSALVSWTDASLNETSFTISRRAQTAGSWGAWTDVATRPANAVSFSNPGLATGGSYQYRVRACSESGCSPWVLSPVITLPTAPPAAPFGLAVSASSGTTGVLTWQDGSVDETSFAIQRSVRNADGTWPALTAFTTRGENITSFTNTGLIAGGAYRYQVRACNAAGCSAWASSPTLTMPVIPPAPGTPAAAVLSGSAIRVTWTDGSTAETSLQLQRASVSGTAVVGSFATLATLASNVIGFSNSGLTPGGRYQYRVRACSAAGCSAYATTATVEIPPLPAAPAGLAGTALSSTHIRLTWTDGANETSYQVLRALRNTDGTWGAYTAVATPGADAASYDATGLLPGRSYAFRMRACNVAGCSAYATSPIITTPAS